jgi:hypothetical protein
MFLAKTPSAFSTQDTGLNCKDVEEDDTVDMNNFN